MSESINTGTIQAKDLFCGWFQIEIGKHDVQMEHGSLSPCNYGNQRLLR